MIKQLPAALLLRESGFLGLSTGILSTCLPLLYPVRFPKHSIGSDIKESGVLTFRTFYSCRTQSQRREFSSQMQSPLNYFSIVNSIQFSKLLDLVNKSGLTGSVC